MLDETYLLAGLDALSRAHSSDYFVDGHRGAAIISAVYLCREERVEDGVAAAIAGLIDRQWAQTPLCAPFPAEPADPALLGRIVAALDVGVGQLRQAGHNVIFASLALKALRNVPEAVTPSRVEGICRLIEAFDTVYDVSAGGADDVPSLDPPEAMAGFVLRETLRTMDAFRGRGQGWSGHMLTFGRALLDLERLGYGEVADHGLAAFRQYVARTRMGPLSSDKPRPEHPPSELLPLQRAYWERREGQPLHLGHCLKYPYGFYGLAALTRDATLVTRCLAESFRIF